MTTAVQRNMRLFFFGVWAVLMTALTYILGAPSLKVLRRRLGRGGYWTLTTLISVALYLLKAKMLAGAFFSLSVLMGVFDEFEEMGFTFTVSAFFTLLINSLLCAGGFALWVFYIGPKWSQTLLSTIEDSLKPVAELNPKLQFSYPDLMAQLPSAILIAWIIAIYLSILLEGRLLGASEEEAKVIPSMRPQLATLRLPDVCVWVLIASLFGSFSGFAPSWLEVLSINVLNVSIVLFFFQGIAVVAKFFETLRMGPVWQTLFMVVIVIQLFLFVSVLGLLDYWLGFRARMQKRAEALKRET